MLIETLNDLGHDQIYQRAITNFNEYQRRYSRNPRQYDPLAGYQIGNFSYDRTPEGEVFWRTLANIGENRIDEMYEMFTATLKPLVDNQPYRVRTNGLFTVKK